MRLTTGFVFVIDLRLSDASSKRFVADLAEVTTGIFPPALLGFKPSSGDSIFDLEEDAIV